jgi:small subunit ribosomal protein S2
MIIGRTLFNSTTCLSSSESIASQIPRIQTRSFRVEDIHINLPESAYSKSIDELLQEGVLNANVAKWLHRRQMNEQLGNLGAKAEAGYEPHRLITHPPTVDEVTLELLLASQAHLGHATALWHPGNARYIFGIREGVHIISLEATAAHLRRAAKVVHSVADRAGLILFVGTRKGQERAVVGAAKRAHGCHMFDRWIPGTLTNGSKILERCEKKVIDQKDRHLTGFEEQLAPMGSLKPDLVVCLNPVENYVLLHECALHNIPTIGVVDTNCNPTWVTYPIPANDDRSVNKSSYQEPNI